MGGMRRRLCLLLVMIVVVAACASSDLDTAERAPTTETTETTTTDDPAPPGDTSVADIAWEACGDAECATVAAPLDHDDPDGPTIDIHVSRLPASGQRIGALWINFGGPGGTAADTISFWPVPSEISEHFDIVGMDPRGVGESTALECGLSAAELYEPDPTIDDQADVDALLDVSERYVDDCERERGDLLPHLGTRDVARDMDLIRSMMGDDDVNYVGYSYGTSIGQAYADEFPDRVRTMVLDGVVDPAPSGIDVAITQAEGFETALANWAADCPARGCPFSDPIVAVERMLDAAEGGVPAGSLGTLGPGEAATGLAYTLYADSTWSQLDTAVSDVLNSNDGSGMVAFAEAYTGLADFSIYFAVSCLDSTWPTDTDEFLARAKASEAVAPRFGEAIVNDYIRCALWPAPPDPLGAISAPGAPPILVVSTTGDPATPYENGVVVAERLESGVLVTNEGEGHTIVFQGNGCIDDLVTAYLVDASVPDEGITC